MLARLTLFLAALTVSESRVARADETKSESSEPASAEPSTENRERADVGQRTTGGARPAEEASEAREAPSEGGVQTARRPWLFTDDASLPAPRAAYVSSRLTYGSPTSGAVRPFSANASGAGGAVELGAEVGLVNRLSIAASVVSSGLGERVGAGATLAVRGEIAKGEHARVAVAGGALREPGSSMGVFARLSPTVEWGRVRASGTLHMEKIFAKDRDYIDALIMLGASARVAGDFRLGFEYVAQDLEGFFDDEEAEGGVRHFIGPTAAVELAKKRLTIAAGPGVGLTSTTRTLTARLAVTMYLD